MTTPVSVYTTLPDGTLQTIYCTDEHIAIRAPSDYTVLCPTANILAQGVDGVITASAKWKVYSRSVNFAAAGVTHGNVIVFTAPPSRFPGAGEQYAIDSVDNESATVRRIGQPAGVGFPPGVGSNLSGVAFTVQTYQPQIEAVSFYLNRCYAINPMIPARMPCQLYDLRDLRDACVLEVLCRRYLAEVNPSAASQALLKLKAFQEELELIRAGLHLRWKPNVYGETATSNPFSTRLVR